MTCIPREKMPQVDQKDIPALLAYLKVDKNCGVVRMSLPVGLLKPIQCHNKIHWHATRHEVREKPLLVCQDHYILDGNHRWAFMREHNVSEVMCWVIGQPIQQARNIVLHFPKAYCYGDGQYHPVTY